MFGCRHYSMEIQPLQRKIKKLETFFARRPVSKTADGTFLSSEDVLPDFCGEVPFVFAQSELANLTAKNYHITDSVRQKNSVKNFQEVLFFGKFTAP